MTEPIAAELGHLAKPGITPYDDVRLALLDTLVTANAAGELDQAAWEAAFGAAVRSLRMRVIGDAEAELRAAAAHSRYPRRRVRPLLPDAEAADTLLHRMLAEGMPLEHFAGFGDDAVTRRARSAAVDTAWEGAVRIAESEAARWRLLAAHIGAWRRELKWFWVISACVLMIAVLVASWLSGAVRSPAWFHPVNEFWWRLWP